MDQTTPGTTVDEQAASPSEKDVYDAFQDVFNDMNAACTDKRWKKDKIHAAISKREEDADIHQIIKKHGFETVYATIRMLIRHQVFTSPLEAAAYFPERPESAVDVQAQEAQEALDVGYEVTAGIPFKAQHEIMGNLQKTLECFCYAFGRANMQEILQVRGWDCAESVELNQWMDEFLNNPTLFAGRGDQESVKELFKSVAEIRDTVVDRRRIDSEGLMKFLSNAYTLFRLLHVGGQHIEAIDKLRDHVQVALADLDEKKRLLRSSLDTELSKIATEQARLEAEEHETIAGTRVNAEEYQELIGRRLTEDVVSVNRVGNAYYSEYSDSIGHLLTQQAAGKIVIRADSFDVHG